DRIEDAAQTVSAIIAAKIIPCTLEFLDRTTACCVEDYAHVGLPTDCAAVLLMETDGHPAAVAAEAEQMMAIAGAHHARGVGLAKKEWLRLQMGDSSFEVMKQIKKALDPAGLLNPGKIFD